MDGRILNTRLTRGSSSRARTLESQIATKQHLLVRLVDSINQHDGRENQYYAQLLRPHMDFMIHDFPVRIEVIAEQEDQEDAQKGELDILIQRGRELQEILLDALDAMAGLQARADPNYIPPISSWRPPTPPTRRKRPPRSTPKSSTPPPSPPADCSPQLSSTPEESSPPSPPAESSPPVSSTPEDSPTPSQSVEDSPPTLPTSEPADADHEAGSNLLLRRGLRPECPVGEPLDEPRVQAAPVRLSSGGRGPRELATLLYGGESGHQATEDATPHSKVHSSQYALQEGSMGPQENTSSLPSPPSWTLSELSHQPEPPDAQQVSQLSPQLRPGEFHPDDYQTADTPSADRPLLIYDVNYGTRHTSVATTSPALAATIEDFHENFDPLTIWNGGARFNLGTMERPGDRISSEYKNVITMFPSSAQDVSNISYGQRQTWTSYRGTRRIPTSFKAGPPSSLRKEVRCPPPTPSLEALPLTGRPRARVITGGPSLYTNSTQGVSGDHLIRMVNCRVTKSASAAAMSLAVVLKPSANLCNKGKVVTNHDISGGRYHIKYRWKNYVPRWARNHLLSESTQMNRRPTQFTHSRLARTVTSTSTRSEPRIRNSSQEVAGRRLMSVITRRNTQPESYTDMMTLVSPWFSICNESGIVMNDGMSIGDHHRRYMQWVTYGPRYAQPHLCNSLDQMIPLPVQSILPGRTRKDTRRPPGTTRPGSLPLRGLPPTLTRTTGSSPTSISTQGVSGSLLSRMERSLNRRTGSAVPMFTGVKFDFDICNNRMFVDRHIPRGELHDDITMRATMITSNFTMMYDRGSITTSMVAATFHRMRIKKTLQAPPWTNHSLHDDVRPTFPGNFPIALTDVKVGNIPIAHTDVSPGTFPITLADDTLGTRYTMLPDVSLYQAYYDVLHSRVQDLQSYPRGREDVGMKTSSLSFSECFSGLVTRESRKTTCPAFKPGMMGCCGAAYRAKLKLYIRLQDFRSDMAQNWFLADILTRIQTSSRRK